MSRMNGKFGTYLMEDVYGNKNLEKDKAIEIPLIGTLEEYEIDKKRQRELQKVLSAGSLIPQLKKPDPTSLKTGKIQMSKNQLNKTYSMLKRYIYNKEEEGKR